MLPALKFLRVILMFFLSVGHLTLTKHVYYWHPYFTEEAPNLV